MDTSSVTLHLDIGEGNKEKLNKCNLCDYASGQPGNLRTHIMNEYSEKSHTNATNATLHLLGQTV